MMTVTADAKKRVVVPSAEPGDRFDLQQTEGKVILTRLEPVQPVVRYARKDGLLLAKTDRPITWETTRKALDDFR